MVTQFGELVSGSLARARFLLLCFFVFSMPLIIYLPNTSYSYTKLIFSFGMISVLLLIWIVEFIWNMHTRGRSQLVNTRILAPVLALVGVAALSIISSRSLTISITSLAVVLYFIALYFLVVNCIEDLPQVMTVLGCLVAAGSLIAVYGLLQYFGVFPSSDAESGADAIISTLGNKNYVAEFLTFLFVPALILLLRGRYVLLRCMALVFLGLSVAILLIVGSKGALAALVVSLVFLAASLLLLHFQASVKKAGRWVLPLIMVSAIVIVTLIGVQVARFSSARALQMVPSRAVSQYEREESDTKNYAQANEEGVSTFVSATEAKQSILLRIWNWRLAWEMLKDHPVLGVGLGNYKLEFLDYKAKLIRSSWEQRVYDFYIPRSAQAHNEYIQIAAEMGSLGILALIWVAWSLFAVIKSIRKIGVQERLVYVCLAAGMISFLVVSLISFPLHRPASALVFVVLVGLLHGRDINSFYASNLVKHATAKKGSKILVLLGLSLVAIAIVTVTVLAYRDFRSNLYLEAGTANLEFGNPLEAKKQFTRSIDLAFSPATAEFYLGQTYWTLGNYRLAALFLESSIRGRVTEISYLLLAQSYTELGDNDIAWDYVQKLLDTEPHPIHKVQAYYLRAELFVRRGDLKTAVAQLEHVINQGNGLVKINAYKMTAQIHLEQGQEEVARHFYFQALEEANTQLQEKESTTKRELSNQGMPVYKYERLHMELEELESQVQEIEFALDKLSPP
jgi:O-antigen ligase/Tfp pilus assembly protein PilF